MSFLPYMDLKHKRQKLRERGGERGRDDVDTEGEDRLTAFVHFLWTGSKVETPATALPMAMRTTPPATTLRRRFLREGETPGDAASAISGIIMAAAVSIATVAAAGTVTIPFFSTLPALWKRTKASSP
mgnify:CR=1 FL=1